MTTISDIQKESRARRFGKSTLVNNAFLASCEAGESVVFKSMKYTCFSNKALQELLESVVPEERRIDYTVMTPSIMALRSGYNLAIEKMRENIERVRK